jgi:hypothetical protein
MSEMLSQMHSVRNREARSQWHHHALQVSSLEGSSQSGWARNYRGIQITRLIRTHFHLIAPLAPVLSQTNPLHVLTSVCVRCIFYIILSVYI